MDSERLRIRNNMIVAMGRFGGQDYMTLGEITLALRFPAGRGMVGEILDDMLRERLVEPGIIVVGFQKLAAYRLQRPTIRGKDR